MKRRSIAILAIACMLPLGMFAQGVLAASATDESYIQCAKMLVEKQLLAPSTAIYSDAQVVERDAYGRVLVTLSVDAQNTFGTPIRSYYAIVINSYNPSTEEFDYYTANGIQEFRDTSYRDTYIEFAKTGSYWGLPLKTSVYCPVRRRCRQEQELLLLCPVSAVGCPPRQKPRHRRRRSFHDDCHIPCALRQRLS